VELETLTTALYPIDDLDFFKDLVFEASQAEDPIDFYKQAHVEIVYKTIYLLIRYVIYKLS